MNSVRYLMAGVIITGEAGLKVFPYTRDFADSIQKVCCSKKGAAGGHPGGFSIPFRYWFILSGEVFFVCNKLPILSYLADVLAPMPVLLRLFVPVRIVLIDVVHTLDVLDSLL